MEELPFELKDLGFSGCVLVDWEPWRSPKWAESARIGVKHATGDYHEYYVLWSWQDGKIRSSFASMAEIFRIVPSFVPKPHRIGQSSRRAEEQKSRRAEEQKSRRAEEQKTRRPEDQKTRRPEDQKTRRPEDQKTRRPEDQKTRRPEDQKTRKTERETSKEKENDAHSPNLKSQPAGADIDRLLYFAIFDFKHLRKDMPAKNEFCSQVASLHRNSMGTEMRFGFHTDIIEEGIRIPANWHPSWAAFFSRMLSCVFEGANNVNHYSAELREEFSGIVNTVIPKLLGELQSNGNDLMPSLVHGNLCDGNTATDLQSGETLVFGASALYAHNEYELGMWRIPGVLFDPSFCGKYFDEIPPSAPDFQWRYRNILYSLKFNLMWMIKYPAAKSLEQQILDDMKLLNNKFGR